MHRWLVVVAMLVSVNAEGAAGEPIELPSGCRDIRHVLSKPLNQLSEEDKQGITLADVLCYKTRMLAGTTKTLEQGRAALEQRGTAPAVMSRARDLESAFERLVQHGKTFRVEPYDRVPYVALVAELRRFMTDLAAFRTEAFGTAWTRGPDDIMTYGVAEQELKWVSSMLDVCVQSNGAALQHSAFAPH